MIKTGMIAAGLALAALPAAAQPPAARPEAIHVRSVGTGERCWILLHPFGASGRFWERRAAILATAHGVRVYSPDLPSHGRSALVERFDYRAATAAVRRALRRNCPRPSLIVGASSGGIVALQLGARLRAPVAAIGVGWSFSDANIASMGRDSTQPSPGLTAWLTNFADQGAPQIARLQRHFADLAAMGTGPFLNRGEARALRGRLLVLWGEADDFFGRESVGALVAAVPRARLESFAGAGHLEPLAPANADRTWQLVGAFAAAPPPG
jgi:pimeloyl-ACP methyl ester carboxylesterase